MFLLLATIFLNTFLAIIFKVFPKFKVDAFQAIVANYVVCVITGCLFLGHVPICIASTQQVWSPYALFMGLGFISVFNLMAYCTRRDGITTSSIANKLSLAIPVIFSIILYHESPSWLKLFGILLAFPAVYLTTRVKEGGKPQSLLLPVLLFIGSGLLDTITKYVEQKFLNTPDIQQVYTIHVFTVAAITGVSICTVLFLQKKLQFSWRNIVAGICVGIPNYFSIYLFIRLLNSHYLQSSAAIPVCNIGVMISSTLMAIFVFREHSNTQRIVGLILSLVAILLITYTDLHV